MGHHYANRQEHCRQKMSSEKLDQLLITSPANICYLTGEELDMGERMCVLLLTQDDAPRLFIHEMFAQALELPVEIEIIAWRDEENPVASLAACLSQQGRTGVDHSWPSSFLIQLVEILPQLQISASNVVEKLREIKDEGEINRLRQSSRIADAVMHQVIQLQHLPATERMMAETIRGFFGEHQVDQLSFRPIIGFGKNSANPHHSIGDTGLLPEQAVVIDMGGIFQQYCSDITRTLFYGTGNKRFEEVYQIVKYAQEEAISMVKPGVPFASIDQMIREEFAKWGLESYFTHRTGHGIGLELHEGPFLHQNNQEVIQTGMVFSIEPGVYLPGEFGVRIEDIVVVTDNGCEVLTLSPKEVQYIELS